MYCLRQVVLSFAAAGRPSTSDLLVAGFGNALTDVVAYEMAGIQRQDIYMIDKKSRINCMDKHGGDMPVSDEVKVSSQGDLVVKLESQLTLETQDSMSVVGESEESKSQVQSRRSSRKISRQCSASYAALIGRSYNSYHDPDLIEDVKAKMAKA